MVSDPGWYAIIDCAQDPRLLGLIEQCRDRVCLFKGDTVAKLAPVSPWLVRIAQDEPLLAHWQEYGKGRNWGVMLLSALSLAELQRQLRKFLQAVLPDGTIALFRFYDPRVFNTYVNAATPEELAKLFDGIAQFAVEHDGGEGLHQYTLRSGQLRDVGAG